MEIFIFGVIFLPIIFATLVYLFNNKKFNKLLIFIQTIITLMIFAIINHILKYGQYIHEIGGWTKGIAIELRVDSLSVLFMLMGLIGFWYIYGYTWKEKKEDSKFIFFITFLQGTIYANFFLYDIFSIYVILEIITIISSILIIYKKNGESVRAGLYYLIFNSIGMTLFFIGTMIIYMNTGTLNGSVIKDYILVTGLTKEILAGFSFMLIAFMLKAALFPLCNWLPIAHAEAPSAISAILSGLIVKLGIYGIIRIIQIFNINIFNNFLVIIGIMTAFFGFSLAICQTDIKRILAYHTISQVGLIVIGLGASDYEINTGSILHIFNHFLFKSLLFLSAGIIADIYGHRNVKRMKGLLKKNKWVAFSLIIGILAITGAPFFIGSISKTLIKKGDYFIDLTSVFNFINLGTIISFTKLGTILFGENEKSLKPFSGKIYTVLALGVLIVLAYPAEIVALRVLGMTKGMFKISYLIKEILNYIILFGISIAVYINLVSKPPKFIKKLDGYFVDFQESNRSLVLLSGILILYVRYFID